MRDWTAKPWKVEEMDSLDTEFLSALRRVGWDDTETPAARWLSGRGMDARRRLHVGGVGAMRATLHPSSGFFEPHLDGERVLVLPVFDGPVADLIEFGDDAEIEISDLVAWRPADPTRLYRRTGEAALVGVGGIDASLEAGAALRVFRSVEAFIVAGGETGAGAEEVACGVHGHHRQIRLACVVLDLKAAAPQLRSIREIVADSLEHGEEIEAALLAARPALPTINLPAPIRRAA